MTISSTTRKAGPFPGNGVATTFPFAFKVFAKTDIKLLLVDTSGVSSTLTLDSDYSVALNSDQDANPGGAITYPILGSPMPSTYSLVALGNLPDLQPTDITNSGGFYPQVVEDALDRATIQIQQLAEITSRAIVVTEAENTAPALPPAAARAGTLLGFDASGNVETFPITTSVGAGDLKNEFWKAGTDFTPGVSTYVQLSRAYASKANIGTLVIDGLGQAPDTYQVTADAKVQFLDDSGNVTPIPAGTSKIYCIGGTTLSIFKPADGSVTDDSVSAGTALYERIFDCVSITDPRYGAKCDAVRDATGNYVSGTDDTAAVQKCVNENKYVRVPAGKTYYSASGIDMSTVCKSFDATAAWMVGPGSTGSVDGFRFSNFYQGAGDIQQRAERFILPSMQGFRHGVHLYNSAFLRIHADTIRNVVFGFFSTCDSAANYCMENELTARHIWHARNSANTDGGAFGVQMTATATASYQGNRCRVFYADDCWTAVKQDFSSTGAGGNINNLYEILECDQCTWAVYNTKQFSSGNTFRFPMGITSPGNANMFHNWDRQDSVDILGVKTNNPAFAAAVNFQWIGVSNRVFLALPSGGVPTLYVSPTGDDTNGTGHDDAPFATIQKAVDTFSELDLNGNIVYVACRDGTYGAGATLSKPVNGKIAVIGDTTTPNNVVTNGSFTADGPGTYLSVSAMMLRGGIVGQNGGRVDVDSSLTFDAFAGGRHIYAYNHGMVKLNAAYNVTGQASYHMLAQLNGTIVNNGAGSATCTGTFSFSAFAQAQQGGQIEVAGMTFSGSGVGGQRYYATKGGGINTGGGGANFFPGSVAGAYDTSGWYA